jgi:tetratricopeptide (TPR) repeat protein
MVPGAAADPFDDLYGTPSMVPMPPASDGLVESEGCNSWTESGVRSPTVSVSRLAVPGKASGEYQKGCGAYKDKRFDQAERHFRKAIDIYPSYPAAWVVLGQVLDAQHEREDARQACSQAIKIDPTYVAPYLCLAEFSATEDDWKQVSNLSERALALDPVNNPYSLYYTADAAFHLNNLAEAEKKALASVALDTWHHLPQLHLLLAQIYAAKGDLDSEAAQLRNYLKVAPNSGDAAGARDTLAQLQSRPGPAKAGPRR